MESTIAEEVKPKSWVRPKITTSSVQNFNTFAKFTREGFTKTDEYGNRIMDEDANFMLKTGIFGLKTELLDIRRNHLENAISDPLLIKEADELIKNYEKASNEYVRAIIKSGVVSPEQLTFWRLIEDRRKMLDHSNSSGR